MAALPVKEREISKQRGEPMEIWLPKLFEQYRTPFKVAAAVGVYEGTVRHWMKKIGYQYQGAKRSA